MAKRRTVANPLALAVLAWLTTGPMHPYELGRRLIETGKDRNIKFNRGSLYMVIEQLAKAGFVTAQETLRDTQRPERTVYAITETGRAELFDWMRELIAEPQQEYPRFGVALSLLSVLPPLEAAELLDRRADALATEIAENRAMVEQATANGLARLFLVEEEYRIGQLTAEHRFVVDLGKSLRDPELVRAWQEAMAKFLGE